MTPAPATLGRSLLLLNMRVSSEMENIWPPYVVLRYCPPGTDPVSFALVMRRDSEPAIVIRANWHRGLCAADRDYLADLIHYWSATPPDRTAALLEELQDLCMGVLTISQEGEATPEALASIVYELC
jgi:hypothetical protein